MAAVFFFKAFFFSANGPKILAIFWWLILINFFWANIRYCLAVGQLSIRLGREWQQEEDMNVRERTSKSELAEVGRGGKTSRIIEEGKVVKIGEWGIM